MEPRELLDCVARMTPEEKAELGAALRIDKIREDSTSAGRGGYCLDSTPLIQPDLRPKPVDPETIRRLKQALADYRRRPAPIVVAPAGVESVPAPSDLWLAAYADARRLLGLTSAARFVALQDLKVTDPTRYTLVKHQLQCWGLASSPDSVEAADPGPESPGRQVAIGGGVAEVIETAAGIALLPTDPEARRRLLLGEFSSGAELPVTNMTGPGHEQHADGGESVTVVGDLGATPEDLRKAAEPISMPVVDATITPARSLPEDFVTYAGSFELESTEFLRDEKLVIPRGDRLAAEAGGPELRAGSKVLLREVTFLGIQDNWDEHRDEELAAGFLRPLSPEGVVGRGIMANGWLCVDLPTADPDRPCTVSVAREDVTPLG